MDKLNIIEIPLYKYEIIEPLGTKYKFWFKDDDGQMKLFKEGRPNTGENWVEVVVAEICILLDIPHATYKFAVWNNKKGTVTPSFIPLNHRLIHGNELLAKTYNLIDKSVSYPLEKNKDNKSYKIREYKLKLVLRIMEANFLKLPIGYQNDKLKNPIDIFIGYIMLDCLISNQDRHHENWSWIISPSKEIFLSPTYDHASGLGCRESDEEKTERLQTKDRGRMVEHFVRRAKTPFFDNGDRNLKTIEAFKLCAYSNKDIAIYWLEILEQLDINRVKKIFDTIPNALISDVSIEFAIKILEENRKRLLELKKELSDV
ncbi:MAG: hypothetical protein QM493_02190 [Sulfurovum sp.]